MIPLEESSADLSTHSATVRLTVSAVISQSHGGGLISLSLLSVSRTDLPIHTAGGSGNAKTSTVGV